MHLARSGRVIIKLTSKVQEGQIICNKNFEKLAKVSEIIGPVAKPYASAIPTSNKVKKMTGSKIFALEKTPAKKYKKNRRKIRK